MEKELDSKIFMINDYSDKNNMEEHIKEYKAYKQRERNWLIGYRIAEEEFKKFLTQGIYIIF